MNRLEESVSAWPVNGLPATLAGRTRRVYDRLAAVYPVSTMLFHSRAHSCALGASGLRDGMKVLEVATGSGEMFRRLIRAELQRHEVLEVLLRRFVEGLVIEGKLHQVG